MFDTFCQQAFLRKYKEVQIFIQNSLSTLEYMISGVSINSSNFEPKHELHPWIINVEKAVQLIGNFKIEQKSKAAIVQSSVNEISSQSNQTMTFKKVLKSFAKFPKPNNSNNWVSVLQGYFKKVWSRYA